VGSGFPKRVIIRMARVGEKAGRKSVTDWVGRRSEAESANG
jgi:hypothetical protein